MKILKKYYPVLIVLLLLFGSNQSCKKAEYPGFSKTRSGIYYKLLSVGETEYKPQIGDYITADLTYKTTKDSVFFNGRRRFQLEEPEAKGTIEECFSMMNPGEKAIFIISADIFFKKTLSTSIPSFIEPGSKIQVEIQIVNIQTAQQYVDEKAAFLRWINDFGEYEKEILSQFIRNQKINIQPDSNGLIILTINKGFGKKAQIGDTITIDYEGRFLDGVFFDSTIKRKESFQFILGTEWQVVPGIENALLKMEEGEKAVVIMPSDQAFGQEGSSTGIVPPFTSLVFEIHLLKVN